VIKIGDYVYHEADAYWDCDWVLDGKEECLGHLLYTDEDAAKAIETEINDARTGRC